MEDLTPEELELIINCLLNIEVCGNAQQVLEMAGRLLALAQKLRAMRCAPREKEPPA